MLTRFSIPVMAALATLEERSSLSIDRARQVDEIQAGHRPKFAAKRRERNREAA